MRLKKFNFISSQYFTCDISPKRITKKYELEIYTEGRGTSYINGKTYPHTENKIIFAKPGQERFSTGEFHCHALHFTCDDQDMIRALRRIPDCCIVSPELKAQMLEHYHTITSRKSIPAYAALFHILELLYTEDSPSENYGAVPISEVSFIKEYIDEHFTQNIDIKALSEQVYLSPNYLRKKFSEAYGTTIQKYIIDMRLGMVKKMLLTTSKSLSEIAYCSGFNSQSHMNVMFRSVFGITPLEYKKQYNNNSTP